MTTGILGPAKAVGCMAKISEPVRTVRTGTFDGMQIQADQLYDNYIITLDYGERTMAVVESGFCQKDSRAPQMEIFGTKGTITFVNNGNMNPLDSLEVYLDAPERGIRGWLKPMEWDVPASEMNFFQCKVVQDLIHAIEEDRPVGCPRSTPDTWWTSCALFRKRSRQRALSRCTPLSEQRGTDHR